MQPIEAYMYEANPADTGAGDANSAVMDKACTAYKYSTSGELDLSNLTC